MRIVVIDDSAFVTQVLQRAMPSSGHALDIVGVASTVTEGLALLERQRPDAAVVDLDLPDRSGLRLIEEAIARWPSLRIVVLSSFAGRGEAAASRLEEVFRAGAIAAIHKNDVGVADLTRLTAAIASALDEAPHLATAGVVRAPARAGRPTLDPPGRRPASLVLIGASTGSPTIIETLAAGLPSEAPPWVVAVHMPAAFTGPFAARLARAGRRPALERPAGVFALQPQQIVVIAGGHHGTFDDSGRLVVSASDADDPSPVPCIDRLFESSATAYPGHVLAIVLSGMGADGARGAHAVRAAGGEVWVQDPATCVVGSMPTATLLQVPDAWAAPPADLAARLALRFARPVR